MALVTALRKWPLAAALAGALASGFSAASLLYGRFAMADDVTRSSAQHALDHRELERRVSDIADRAAADSALLRRIDRAVEALDVRLREYPVERHHP